MALGMKYAQGYESCTPRRPPARNIEERAGALRVRLYAGQDPVTGKQVYLRETIQGTDDAAWKRADNKLAEFRTQVLKQRNAQSCVKLGYALDEWMRKTEIQDSTRHTYEGYIRRTIKPALGGEPIKKVTARVLGAFTQGAASLSIAFGTFPRLIGSRFTLANASLTYVAWSGDWIGLPERQAAVVMGWPSQRMPGSLHSARRSASVRGASPRGTARRPGKPPT